MTHLFWLIKVVFKHAKLPFLLSAGLQVLGALVPVAIAASIGGLVGVLTDNEHSWAVVWPWIGVLILAHLLQQSFVINSYKDYLYQQRLEKALDEPVLEKMSRIPLKYFEEPDTHDLFARTLNPSARVQMICEEIIHTMGSWLQMIFLVIYLGTIFWWIGPLFIVLSLIISRFDTSLGARYQEINREFSVPEREKGYLGNLMTDRKGAMEFKLFDLGPHFIDRWKKWFAFIQNGLAKYDLKMLMPVSFLSLLEGLTIFGAILLLVWQIREIGGDVALFTSSVVALMSFITATGRISFNARNLGEGNAYLSEVREMLDLPEREVQEGDKSFPTPMEVGIRFENVSFSYHENGKPVIDNVSLHIKPGEKIALVGANGSGKSTLMKLMLGLYEPDSGNIFIDGTNIKEIDPKSLRKETSVVFQDFGRYSLSIRENIGLGQIEKLNDERAIKEAAILGDADSFIDVLPNQYETPLGRLEENGHEPSGGQWQKIAVSRSLLSEAQVLVFDEPASALDPIAEVKLYNQISRVLEGQTSVLVTHRLGSVHTCDRIIVLDHGKVIETGTHQELMNQGEVYAEMYASQADWYREVSV